MKAIWEIVNWKVSSSSNLVRRDHARIFNFLLLCIETGIIASKFNTIISGLTIGSVFCASLQDVANNLAAAK